MDENLTLWSSEESDNHRAATSTGFVKKNDCVAVERNNGPLTSIYVKKTTVLNTLVTMTLTSDVENSKN